MSHVCHEQFVHNEVTKESADTVEWIGHCRECGTPLIEVYDYQGTYDREADEWVNRVLDETAQRLHNLLSKIVARGRAGEWDDAVDAYTRLDDKPQTLIAEGGREW